MNNSKKINLITIQDKIPNVAFELFRIWTKEMNINKDLLIKNEQKLVIDLQETIIKAIIDLNNSEDLNNKPIGWDVGFVIGFINGNLRTHWHNEYIVKNKEEYKTFIGLRAIKNYLQFDELTKIKINTLYESLMHTDSNICNIDLNVNKVELNVKKLTIDKKSEKGKIQTILNNLIIKQIKIIAEFKNEFSLPIQDFFTIAEIKKLIADNKKLTICLLLIVKQPI